MHEKQVRHRATPSKTLPLSIGLGLIAGLSLSLRLGTYDAPQASFSPSPLAHLFSFLCKFEQALEPPSFQQAIFVFLLVYSFTRLLPLVDGASVRWTVPFAAIAGFSVVLSESFYKAGSWDLVFGEKSLFVIATLKAAGTAALIFAVLTLANAMEIEGARDSNKPMGTRFAFLVIVACWLPYIISLYPSSIVADVSDQVAQIVGDERFCWTATHVNANASGLLLNNHHPVLHTMIIGVFTHIGGMVHSYNAGLFLYAILQCVALALTSAYQVSMVSRACANKGPALCALAFFALNPLFPMWGMTIDKDVYFAILTWWVSFGYYRLVTIPSARTRLFVSWGIQLLLWLLMRNGGLYVLIVSAPLLLWAARGRKDMMPKLGVTIASVVLVYQVAIQTMLFGALGIASGGRQEALSVPFMQTARLVRDHEKDIDPEDRTVLLTLFDTDGSLERLSSAYDGRPTRSDKVKFLFKNDEEDSLGLYLEAWAHGLKEHPGTYLQALMCLDYGWIYPENYENVRAYTGIANEEALNTMLPGVNEPKRLATARSIAAAVLTAIARMPIVGILCEFSYYTWVFLAALALLIVRGKTRELAAMSFLFLNYGICFLGPVACLRYAFPAIVALPTLIVLTALRDSDDADPQRERAASTSGVPHPAPDNRFIESSIEVARASFA